MTRYHTRLITLLLGLVGCQEVDTVEPVAKQPLVGTWQYVERGYSPGSGYFIDKIPAKPVQIISFTAQGTVSAVNLRERCFATARTYRVDSVRLGARLVLFDEKQQELDYSMGIQLRNDTLRLTPPCFEGCHHSFVRLR